MGPLGGGGMGEKRKRSPSPGRAGDTPDKEKENGSSGARRPAGASAVAARHAGYLVEDADALDCSACYRPLKPPIYQCNEGHVVCSSCRDKLAPAGKCRECRTATTSYHRCLVMERLVESIRAPCPNAIYGCNTKPPYYDQHDHRKMCPYGRYGCPDNECGFLGSKDALMDHFTSGHGWPSITKISVFKKHSICLYDGFNFLLADCAEDDNRGSPTTTISSSKHLFLLNVTRLDGCAISVHLISPESPSEILRCVLSYSLEIYDPCESHEFLASHSLKSEINVKCVDPSNGPPDPADCSHFFVPYSFLGDKNKEATIQVDVHINIINPQ